MKRTACILMAVIALLTCTACSGRTQSEAQISEAQVSEPVRITENSTAASEVSSVSSVSESQESLPPVSEAEFNDDTDLSDTLAGRFADVSRFSDRTKKYVIGVLNGSKFTLEAQGKLALTKDAETDLSVFVSRDGDSAALKLSVAGMDTSVIRNENGTYILDDNAKTATPVSDDRTEEGAFYTNPASIQAFAFMASLFGSDKISYTGSGSDNFEGYALCYEEYSVGSSTLRLYYDGNALKYVVINMNGASTVIGITRLTADADDSSFEIPEGYTVKGN